ncbi:FAD/NAD(P)-binding protein [Pseudomonas japonica]|uniref:FAD/NAD(P)-binding protein n=1 Tax=Pseudomonas japonica TaxID=256466 RepID=UPI0037FD00F7
MPLSTPVRSSAAHTIAIIGSGPRGLSVLERLAALMLEQPPSRPVIIHLIEKGPMGTGRVWRTDQPAHYVMNTVAEEVSSFSGPSDGGPARPGAGPSLAQWWSTAGLEYSGPNTYAPRAVHGHYMKFVLSTIEASFSVNVSLQCITAEVIDLAINDHAYRLQLHGGGQIQADKVIIATGHPIPELVGWEKNLQTFAARNPQVTYLRGDSAADMPLAAIDANQKVGIIGLGLAFHDIVADLTVGRGGRFSVVDGQTLYSPSGVEPKLFAGSRSGMLIPARGKNQKNPNFQYQPLYITRAKIDALQRRGHIDFASEVLPLLLIEVNIVYYATAVRAHAGSIAELSFKQQVAQHQIFTLAGLTTEAERHGVVELAPLDLDSLARPFSGKAFSSPEAFTAALDEVLLEDLRRARGGNIDDPVKAALDIIRDTRALIRSVVDFGRLDPQSHQEDFLGHYAPTSLFLTAGPPLYRTEQIRALIAAGVLTIVGPETLFDIDPNLKLFTLESPQVSNSRRFVEVLIDARIPSPDLRRDPSSLTRSLVRRGYWNNFVNQGKHGQFVTGGVNVTPWPYHPIAADGQCIDGLYVLGLPCEHTRWFMQAGSSRPGFWTDFAQDAHYVAHHALAPAYSQVIAGLTETA